MSEFGMDKNKITHFLVISLALGSFAVVLYPFVSILALAGIFAFVLHPFVIKLQRAKWVSLQKSMIVILLLFFLFVAIPFAIVGAKVFKLMKELAASQNGKEQFIARFSEQTNSIKGLVSRNLESWGLSNQFSFDEMFVDVTQKTATFLFNFLSEMISAVPSFILGLFIFLLALFFFVTESQRIGAFFRRSKIFSHREISILIESLKVSCNSAVFSSVVTGLVQATLVAIGAEWTDSADFSLAFTITFLFSFVPVLGAGPVAFTLALLAFLNQQTSSAVILLVTGVVAGLIDNIIRPLLMGQKENPIHPFITLLSLLGGIIVFGFPGLFIGPVLAQVTWISIPLLLESRTEDSNENSSQVLATNESVVKKTD